MLLTSPFIERPLAVADSVAAPRLFGVNLISTNQPDCRAASGVLTLPRPRRCGTVACAKVELEKAWAVGAIAPSFVFHGNAVGACGAVTPRRQRIEENAVTVGIGVGILDPKRRPAERACNAAQPQSACTRDVQRSTNTRLWRRSMLSTVCQLPQLLKEMGL